MILLTERIEEALTGCLQRNVQITVKDRKIANGKLILYKIDGFYIQLTFQGATSLEHVDIPYPFNTIKEGTKLLFDYRLESLAEKDFNLLFILQSISKKRESKFYNSLLEIAQV